MCWGIIRFEGISGVGLMGGCVEAAPGGYRLG